MKLGRVEILDTYAEAFDGLYFRVIVTADDEETVKRAAEDATATPSIVIGRIEGGVERMLREDETPDGRVGAILQFWSAFREDKPLKEIVDTPKGDRRQVLQGGLIQDKAGYTR